MFEDITRVSQMAKAAVAKDPKVINATVGVLLDDNGDILYSNVFDSIFLSYDKQRRQQSSADAII